MSKKPETHVIEYLDLRSNAESFTQLPIKNLERQIVEPMLFPDKICDTEDEEASVWNFFGGADGPGASPLQQLVIRWGGQDLRQPTQVEVRRVACVEFPGSPSFSQNLPNKRFAGGTWVFVADDGREYRYTPETKKVEYRDLSSIEE